jgi:hypothetical protein
MVLVIEYLNLRFNWNLGLGICDFNHMILRRSYLSLT